MGDFPEGHISPETGAVPAPTILTVVGQQHVALLFTFFLSILPDFQKQDQDPKVFQGFGFTLPENIKYGKKMQEESRSGYE